MIAGLPSGRVVDVTKLREDLILKLERERSDQVVQLRAKQKQVGICTSYGILYHTLL